MKLRSLRCVKISFTLFISIEILTRLTFIIILLKEWILASRIVVPDDLGLRLPERTRIRPQSNKRGNSFVADVGYIVDAWWHDGWWEGIVIQKEFDARYHAKYNVYFPGTAFLFIFLHLSYKCKLVNSFCGS